MDLIEKIKNEDKDLYTVREIAEILKVSEATVRNWIKLFKMKAIKLGGITSRKSKFLITKQFFIEFLENHIYTKLFDEEILKQ